MISRILDHDRISVRLNTRYERRDDRSFDHIFYSGALDAFFEHQLGRLSYRTVTFERIDALGDYLWKCSDQLSWNGGRLYTYPRAQAFYALGRSRSYGGVSRNQQGNFCHRYPLLPKSD